ncbi:MAG: hypothetical protein KF866_02150 [Phycisphaeraceae bacterium]|nr:hypothetical protein [Phycisphaeraceae bacterium]MCW5753505.1 hypothetical protein [Phycisphaeraceae bacterium]
MLAKMMVLIVSAGACGAGVLALRQARLEAARELAESRLRVMAVEEQLARVRADIARRLHPANLHQMSETLGPLTPIIRDQPAPAAPDIHPFGPHPEHY